MVKGLKVVPDEPGRRQVIRIVAGWTIYLGALGAGGIVGACGRTPLGDPFGDGPQPTPSGSLTPTPTGPTPSPTATVDPCDCSVISGSDTGLTRADFQLNSVAYKSGVAAFICLDSGGFYAMTSNCTHSGCDMGIQAGSFSMSNLGGGFQCSCHGSRFDANGAVSQGPASQPLHHLRLRIDSAGHLFLDISLPFPDAPCRCP